MPYTRSVPFALVLALFFVSGATSLVYEVVWTRRLTVVFGSGLFATSTILAMFMGGLALGAWWLGRGADRRIDPLGYYGWLEIGIGIYALLVPFLQTGMIPVYRVVYGMSDGASWMINATRVGLCAAVFVVPTVLMGATLPALARFVTHGPGGIGARIGRLYAINTWGAVVGCLATGFLFVEWLGLRGSELTAAAANLAVGACAIFLGRHARRIGATLQPELPVEPLSVAPARDRTLVLVAYALSGFTALAYEVIWARFLTFFLGNSTYAFTTMLGTFLIGLALGALVGARFVDRLRDPFGTFAVIEWLIGLSMAVALVVYPSTPRVYAFLSEVLPGRGWGEMIALHFAAGFLILVAPALLLGAAFPLAGRLYLAGSRRVGSEIGALYAANTLGAVLGSLAAGFLLVPRLGFRGSVLLIVGLNALIAASLALRSRRLRIAVPTAAILLVVGAVVAVPRDIFLSTIQRAFPHEKIIHYEEEPSATVFVTRTRDDERWVHFSDRRASGGTMNLPGHRIWGHLPAMLSEKRESALVICFGSGITLGAVATHPFKRIVCAEISEGIRDAAAFFPENHGVLDDPRVQLVTDDGRNVLLGTRESFDVIVSEPPLLETAGVVNLFTREFYELVRTRLNPGGVFCQWVPSFEFTRDEHALVIRTFLEVFPDATFWGSPLYADTMLIGSNEPIRIDVERIAERFGDRRVRRDLAEAQIDGPAELLGYFGLGADGLRRYAGDGPILTDDRTILDFVMPRSRFEPRSPAAATFWKRRLRISPDVLRMQAAESVLPLVDLPGDDGRWRAEIRKIESSHALVIRGHIAGVEGRPGEQTRRYDEALALAPDYVTARYYASLNRIERAFLAASSGNRNTALTLATEARSLSRGFDHLERILAGMPGK